MTTPTAARDRLARFVAGYPSLLGLDPEEVYTIHVRPDGEADTILLSDLRTLLAAIPDVTPDARRHGGYVFGRTDATGEVGTSPVCAHGSPLGWACPGCAADIGRKAGTAPAGPAADTRYRAVCDQCGSRVWFPSAMVPEEVRLIVDREEAEAMARSKARHAEAFAR